MAERNGSDEEKDTISVRINDKLSIRHPNILLPNKGVDVTEDLRLRTYEIIYPYLEALHLSIPELVAGGYGGKAFPSRLWGAKHVAWIKDVEDFCPPTNSFRSFRYGFHLRYLERDGRRKIEKFSLDIKQRYEESKFDDEGKLEGVRYHYMPYSDVSLVTFFHEDALALLDLKYSPSNYYSFMGELVSERALLAKLERTFNISVNGYRLFSNYYLSHVKIQLVGRPEIIIEGIGKVGSLIGGILFRLRILPSSHDVLEYHPDKKVFKSSTAPCPDISEKEFLDFISAAMALTEGPRAESVKRKPKQKKAS